jgi:hypothetical protein
MAWKPAIADPAAGIRIDGPGLMPGQKRLPRNFGRLLRRLVIGCESRIATRRFE